MSGMSFLDNLHLSDQPKQGELEISVFGRGFGECIVIGCGNGDYAVIDSFQNAETKRPIALDYLEKIGVDPKTAIKEVIITHWHSDHIGMMSELIKTANNSQIIINPVFSNRTYQQYMSIATQEQQDSTSEYAKVLPLLQEKKSCIRLAKSRNGIYENEKLQIIALSPQDGEIIEKYLPFLTGSEDRIRREYQTDNLLSIVLLVKPKKSDGVLLGSDMEVIDEEDAGWNGVVRNYNPFNGKASLFKVPHHGSATGHKQEVWTEMLTSHPISFITTYNKGHKLPKDDDILRVNSLSGETYLIGNKNKQDKQMEREVRKTCPGIEIEQISTAVGLVRYRKNMDIVSAQPVIECFGAARKVHPSV